jgi:hypothetical protein
LPQIQIPIVRFAIVVAMGGNGGENLANTIMPTTHQAWMALTPIMADCANVINPGQQSPQIGKSLGQFAKFRKLHIGENKVDAYKNRMG